MAGHNKWSQIKHKKAKEDAKRGKAFTKLSKEISVAARQAGGDPNMNVRLRHYIEKAKSNNMPQENIIRAIKRGTGELPGVHYESYTYEGYGPFGIAVIIEALTDNKNRMVADLRHIFSKGGGALSESGSVNWMFKHMGVIRGTSSLREDALLESLIEYDIADIKQDDTFFSIFVQPGSLDTVKKSAQDIGLSIDSAELEWVAQNSMALSDDKAEKAVEFLSTLHDHDDIQNVYTNLA